MLGRVDVENPLWLLDKSRPERKAAASKGTVRLELDAHVC